MTIGAILAVKSDAVVSIATDATVSEAVALLASRRIGAVPVMRDGEVIGIFSERDVINCLAAQGEAALRNSVSDVMTAPAITVTPETAVLAALSLMTRRRIRHLPVLDNASVVGFISIGDLVKHRIDHIEAEAEAMRDYIQGG